MCDQVKLYVTLLSRFVGRQIHVLTILCSLAFVLLGGACNSNNSGALRVASPRVPQIALDRTTYDFGRISPGSSCMAVFRLTNAGNAGLCITDVKRCCGAVIKLEKDKLASGESGVLTAEYRAGLESGALVKKIGLVTNDPMNPQIDLTIKADVVSTLAWAPIRFAISPYRQNTECPVITIKSLNGTDFSIKEFAATDGCFTGDFDPRRRAKEFAVKAKPDMAKLRAFSTANGAIRFYLEHPDYKFIDVPFSVNLPLQAVPSQLLAFNVKPGEPVLRPLRLLDNEADPSGDAAVEIASIASRNGSRVELRDADASKTSCDLKLAIWPIGAKENESFSTDQLVIRMKDGRELTVPVRVFYQVPGVSGAPHSTPSL